MSKLTHIYNNDYSVLVNILNQIHIEGPVDLSILELLAHAKLNNPTKFKEFENELMYLLGSFYKTTEPETLRGKIYSVFLDAIKEDTGQLYTPVQASIFRNIYEKKYFSFSAPTSAGKSHLFRELIKNESGDIVIVLPSRALIAEYMNKVLEILENDHNVLVLQFIDVINKENTDRRIFIITPERGVELFKYINDLNIKLFLFDEAQISESGLRGLRFDAFVRRVDKLVPDAKKIFAHPFIANPEAQLNKHQFYSNSNAVNYKQVAVGKMFMKISDKGLSFFSPYDEMFNMEIEADIIEEILKNNGTLYVYVSKNKIYEGKYLIDFAKYIEMCPKITDINALKIIDTLKEYIGATDRTKYSNLINQMKHGIVTHHGSMPLKARLLVEDFINNGYARICFATSTLTQGINMPFDIVLIDNFYFDGDDEAKALSMKNLIGRAGRTTQKKDVFDYGYVIVKEKNMQTFKERYLGTPKLSNSSLLDDDFDDLQIDYVDIAKAIKDDSFDDDLQLTENQIERLTTDEVFKDVEFILDNLLKDNVPVTGASYYYIKNSVRTKIKTSFRNIFVSHLRRTEITRYEKEVLSASIPVLLWRIQGKSFKEIISLRLYYLARKQDEKEIIRKVKNGEIKNTEGEKEINKLMVRRSPRAFPLPNSQLISFNLFPRTKIKDIDYDTLVYDTYDYLDKVVSLSIADPICGALIKYYEKYKDNRALAMKNFVRYRTDDTKEIWLIRYGFGFDDIEWIKHYVDDIDENKIQFNYSVKELSKEQYKVISRYIPID
ncbi:MAG: helicase [Denitrovibrio sp.]|nr:MAG: helicase [Denitrovibrio sp.]